MGRLRSLRAHEVLFDDSPKSPIGFKRFVSEMERLPPMKSDPEIHFRLVRMVYAFLVGNNFYDFRVHDMHIPTTDSPNGYAIMECTSPNGPASTALHLVTTKTDLGFRVLIEIHPNGYSVPVDTAPLYNMEAFYNFAVTRILTLLTCVPPLPM